MPESSEVTSIPKLLNPASEHSGGARALAARGRAFSLEVASFALTLKFSEAPEAAAAAKIANLRRVDRFDLDLTPVSTSI